MSTPGLEPQTDVVPPLVSRPRRHPMGLPAGSVRAILSLAVVASVIAEAARNHTLDPRLSETLTLILGQYFATRRTVKLSRQTERRLAAEGLIEPEPPPLYLPRFTIRAVMIVSFVGLAAYLYHAGRLWTTAAMSTVGLVLAYFLGVLVHWVIGRGGRRSGPGELARFIEDVKAILALAAALAVAAYYLLDRPPLLQPGLEQGLKDWTLAIILFYFGSR